MIARRRVLLLVLAMIAVVAVTCTITIVLLYRSALTAAGDRLLESVQSHARLIEATSAGNDESRILTELRLALAQYHDRGTAVEIGLARRRDARMEFLITRRDGVMVDRPSIAWDSTLAEPMRRALLGRSGICIALDYRGEQVLAAHEPVVGQGWGMVAKIDMAEIRAPFLRSGLTTVAIVMVAMALGSLLIIRVTRPMIQELDTGVTALSASEARLRSLVDAMAEGVAFHELVRDGAGQVVDYRVLAVNPAYSAQTGMAAGAVCGRLASAIYGVGVPPYLDSYAHVAENGAPTSFEVFFPPLGKHFHISVFSPQRDHFVTVFTDITERKRAADMLRVNEERLRFAMETIHIGVWDLDLVDHSAFRSLEHDRIFGYAELLPDWSYERFLEHVLPEDRALVDDRFQLAVRNQADWGFECRICRADGEVRWIWAAGRHQTSSDGTAYRMAGIVQDITGRKQAEAALLASEARFRAAIINAPFPIMLHAEDGAVLTLSQAWTDITGYAPEDIRTTSAWAERAYGEHRQMVQDEIEALYALAARRDEGAYVVICRDGTRRIWHFSSAPLGRLVDGRRAVISMALDVTERQRAEDEVRRLNASLEERVRERTTQLEAANRELESFSYSVSHDLRAPLRHVSGFVDLLRDHCGATLDDIARQHLDTIATAAKRMGRLIDDLLLFSRMGRSVMNVESCDCGLMMRELITESAHDYAGREVVWEIGDLPVIDADHAMLRQVFANLLGNALKYTRQRARAVIAVRAVTTATEATLTIADNGAGFDMHYADKLFGVFQRLHSDREFEGTGIGLAHAQRIVHRHGGRIRAEGVVDGGATFHITLPLHQEPRT